MAFEQKDMSGAIFKNDKKVEGSKQPDRKGDCVINGKAYWVSGWLKDGKRADGRGIGAAHHDGRRENDELVADHQSAL